MTASTSALPAIVAEIRPCIQQIGWSEFALRSGLERSLLYKNFGLKARQVPRIDTLERALACLGLELTVTPRGAR